MPSRISSPSPVRRVAVLADSDTRWKWGALTARRIAPGARVDGLLLRGRATPTPRQLAEVGVGVDTLREVTGAEFVRTAAGGAYEVVVLACVGGAVQAMLHGLARAARGSAGVRRPVTVTGYVGVVYEKLADGLLLRHGADVVLANSRHDAERFRAVYDGVGADAGSIVECALPFLAGTPADAGAVHDDAAPGAEHPERVRPGGERRTAPVPPARRPRGTGTAGSPAPAAADGAGNAPPTAPGTLPGTVPGQQPGVVSATLSATVSVREGDETRPCPDAGHEARHAGGSAVLDEAGHAAGGETAFTLTFAVQPSVPHGRADRAYLLRRAVEHARAHPEREVLVKLRSKPGEHTTHIEEQPYQKLAARVPGGLPPNCRLVYGHMGEVLDRTDLLVTVSSTAALESLHRSVPTAVLTDLGVREALGNHHFLGSGCLASWDELDAGHLPEADPEWTARQGVCPGGSHAAAFDAARDRVAALVTADELPPPAPYYTPVTAPGYLPRILARYGFQPDGSPRPGAARATDASAGPRAALRNAVREAARGAYRHGVQRVAPILRRLGDL